MTHWTERQLTRHLDRTGVPGASNGTDVSEPPFAVPDIILDLPRPISVNELRRVNWQAHKRAKQWRETANTYLLVAKNMKKVRFDRIDRFELTIILDETRVFIDLDNTIKMLIDYLCDVGIVKNDAPKNLRKLLVEWGDAPLGARVIVRPCA